MIESTPHRPEKPDEPARGLECRDCGCRHFRVFKTRHRPDKIIRWRRCRYCGKQVMTTERITG